MDALTIKHKQFFGSHVPACTVWGVTELYQPHVLIEIKLTVRLDLPKGYKTIMTGMPQVVVANETAWVSGQFAHDTEGNPVGEGDFEQQCEASFANLDKCLAAIGATRNQVVHTGVMVVGLSENGAKVSAAHKKYFGDHPPASTVWGVPGLGLPFMKVEICAIVRLERHSFQKG
ncbi:hypothetical protein PHYBOEH_001804 [Phytophthora boehmeriae]|uniref:Uncharacterized protein n=1 Tax=Phytophthora boehmeriae TaxID=109152 RepID=A0A8T1WTI6_9STRA|nr:hypothetical protein PHYBOEH_001804 [Phytophthora boehmeriae]